MKKIRKATIDNRLSSYDLLRPLCAFLVIVTHTNSNLFKASAPNEPIWWFSILWFYLSKIAVPIFVMISGACLLEKTDTPKKALHRLLRMAAVLLLFGYAYYVYDAWVHYGLWPRMIQFNTFFSLLLQNQLTNSFWYLPFYMGLLMLLPFLQRAVRQVTPKAAWCFVGLCLFFDGVVPLMNHLFALPAFSYLYTPLFSTYLALFLAGHLLKRTFCSKLQALMLLLAAAVCVLLCGLLTMREYSCTGGYRYWRFLDDRMHPPVLICLAAGCVFMCVQSLLRQKCSGRFLSSLGGCAFGIYLLQDWVISVTKGKLWPLLIQQLPPVPAMLIWEIAVFLLCFAAVWLIRRIPFMRKLI